MGVLILVLAWLALIFIGYPIGLSLLVSCVGYLLLAGYGLPSVAGQMFNVLNSFPILALPMFIFAANLMNKTGVTDRLFNFAQSLVGQIGRAHV